MENKIIEKGKLPPQAIDLEEAVLGSMMVDRNGINQAIEIINADVFYKEEHKTIFNAIFDLYEKNNPIDLLTVSSELKRNGNLEKAGGDFYLIRLTQKTSSSAHIEYWCRILMQKFIQRKCITVSNEINEKSYDEDVDVFQLLEETYKNLGQVTDMISVGKVSDFKESVLSYFSEKNTNKKGIPSCIPAINKKLNGYQDTDLIILAARPGMGKTAFTLNEILECALSGNPVVFFSLEMSEKQIINRLLAIISGIDVTKINSHNVHGNELLYLKQCADLLVTLPIIIDDSSALSPIELKLKANKYKREHKIKMIVVDYLQLMKIKNRKGINREQEISEISSALKGIAKELKVPLIALSQLSRAVEQRGSSKRPMLSDLRDSGSIEQDADIVMFIYRPEYYGIEEWDDEERTSTKDQAEIDIAKYRHGETGYCRMGCLLQFMRFMDVDDMYSDMSGKYFKKNKPEKPIIEEKPLPIINPNDAFDSVGSNYNDEEELDVPF